MKSFLAALLFAACISTTVANARPTELHDDVLRHGRRDTSCSTECW